MTQPVATPRVRRTQWLALTMLLFGGAIAYVDRATLSIANPLIRKEMGLSVADMGLLLSAFLWAYAIAQLPAGGIVDRLKPRLALGLGLMFWSVAQLFGGFVGNFWQFVTARVALGLGESPQYLTGSRVARDWFHAKDRGLATGVFISASAFGTAISAPMLTFLMLAFGWRWMFAIMGFAGLVLGGLWLAFYRDPEKAGLTAEERAYLVEGDVRSTAKPESNLREWGRMFRFRTTWGVVAGHFGEVYMIWLYTAWLPGYLEMERHMSIKTTGWVAAIPFIAATIGGLWGGWIGDVLVRRGWTPIDSRRYPLTISLLLVGVFTAWAAFIESNIAAVALISVSMFLNQIASTSVWSIAPVASPKKYTASFAGISNCGGYIGAALAPTVTGFIVQATGSFVPALLVGSAVAVVGAILFFGLITVPLTDADLAEAPA